MGRITRFTHSSRADSRAQHRRHRRCEARAELQSQDRAMAGNGKGPRAYHPPEENIDGSAPLPPPSNVAVYGEADPESSHQILSPQLWTGAGVRGGGP